MTEHSKRTPDPIREWRARNPRSERALVLLEADWPPSRAIVLRFMEEVSAVIPDPAAARNLIDRSLGPALQTYKGFVDQGAVPDRDRLLGFLRVLATEVQAYLPEAPSIDDLMVRWLPESLADFLARTDVP